jgi:sec-independent protein translocase protein TatA
MGELFQPTHLLVLGIVFFIIFGAKRLPELGKGLGEGWKGFKDGIKNIGTDSTPAILETAIPASPEAKRVE